MKKCFCCLFLIHCVFEISYGCNENTLRVEQNANNPEISEGIAATRIDNEGKDPCDFSSYHPVRISIERLLKGNVFKPEYPEEAKKKHIEGVVQVKILKDQDGHVLKACAVSGDPLLRKVSEEAALKSTFEPILLNSKKIAYVEDVITFRYVLLENSKHPQVTF